MVLVAIMTLLILAMGVQLFVPGGWGRFSHAPQKASVATAVRPGEPPREAEPGQVWDDPISGLRFCFIPPGSFTMGSAPGAGDPHGREHPAHPVTISQGFWMGTYEVTQAQWKAVMGSNPSDFKGEQCPVEKVNWNDAQSYLASLGSRNTHARYRLPTEAEWEYACRAGSRWWSYYGSLDAIAWHNENSGDRTHPVGQKQPNDWGLYDMSGNVWEWCEDTWHETYAGAPVDGSAWMGGIPDRVIRGGSWKYDPTFCRSALRSYEDPDGRTNNYGFRVVLVARTP